MYLESMVVGPIGANCFVVGDPEARVGAVIDPGDDPEVVLDAVARSGLDVGSVIATHGHFDHTGGVKGVVDALGCDFLMHEADLFFVRD